ncbi:MAG TPA: tetratricopeptide repeat protein [Polyangiaceae bacterium]|jgi:hypothetical protein
MIDLARELAGLGENVRAEQDAWLETEHSLGAVRSAVVSAERPALRLPSLKRKLGGALAVGVAAGALLGVGTRLLVRPPLLASAAAQPLAAGDWIRVRDRQVPLAFSDGTSITLDPGARARLEAIDSAGARLAIETGHADVKVVPGRDGRWHLNLGPFGVDVTGTQFDVGWNPETEELSLTMREGKVIVSGCVLGDGRPLLAGERLTASCRDRRFEVVHIKPEVAAEAANAGPSVANVESSPGHLPATPRLDATPQSVFVHGDAAGPAPESWQVLARAGKYKLALAAANTVGFDNEVTKVSAEDLSLLADTARFGGNVDESIRAYLNLRRRFPHTGLAGNAAFAIGRMEFDQHGAFAEAERWFADYLAEQPRGPLAREALGRRMEALDRAGNHDAAREVAASYQKHYPHGPHIRLAERLLGTR